ncbi:SET and MYND domain-containing protein DDB_G0273591-like [Contarinia nasturtii]|uniref:SET and MYND domain-containing protein DDB_G0273591-like n=1 Tax=Contarinia nasturtii TaxID=265458 RepID=UPI0012D407EC|nr:SET and MYND domain-containing protein DDB_G0273591-like [Contarinia nasturtii]
MTNLWEKESKNVDAHFIDLFADIRNSKSIDEWNRQLQSSWKHRFVLAVFDAVKNNDTANFFRNEGNLYFKQKSWIEAMELYSKSLSFAEPGTVNRSFSYASRASCFFQMKNYDKCLIDIELAVQSNYPEQMMPVLMKRKEDCVRLMKQHTADTPFDPKLSFIASEKFPCMADAIEIQQNKEFGRHIVARCDIDVGQTILVEENFVSTFSSFDRINCYECMQTMKNFLPCNTCVDVMFCSVECEQRSVIHQKCCETNFNRMPLNVQYIGKSILIALCAFNGAKELMDFTENVLSKRTTRLPEAANDAKSKYAFFLSLQSAAKETLDIVTVYKVFTAILDIPFVKGEFHTEERRRFLMHLIGEHFLIISNNSYGGSLSSASTVGTTALVMSFFNHACAPNVFNSSAFNKEICITMRPIKKGEQLFVKYLCGERTTRERQAILLTQWGFLCKCDKCIPKCSQADRMKMKADPNFKQLYPAFSINLQHANYTVLASKCVQFLRTYGHLPWSEEMDVALKTYTKCLLEPFPFS